MRAHRHIPFCRTTGSTCNWLFEDLNGHQYLYTFVYIWYYMVNTICILNHLNFGCEGEEEVCRKSWCDAVSLKELHFSCVKGIQNVIGLIWNKFVLICFLGLPGRKTLCSTKSEALWRLIDMHLPLCSRK